MSLEVKKLLTQPLADDNKLQITNLFLKNPIEVLAELYQIPKDDALFDVATDLLLHFLQNEDFLDLIEDSVEDDEVEQGNKKENNSAVNLSTQLSNSAKLDLQDAATSQKRRHVAACLLSSLLVDMDYASSLCDQLLQVEKHFPIAVELLQCVEYSLMLEADGEDGEEGGLVLEEDEVCKKFLKAILYILNAAVSKSGVSGNEQAAAVAQAIMSLNKIIEVVSSEKSISKFVPIVQKMLKLEQENVRVAALRCLATAYAKYYESFVRTVKLTIQLIAPLIKSASDEEASMAIEVLCSIVEVEHAMGLSKGDSLVVKDEATVLPLLLGALTGSFGGEKSIEKFDLRSEQASTCLNIIAHLSQDDILKHLVPFIKENITSEVVAKKDAAVMAIAVALGGGPKLQKQKTFISDHLPILLAVVNDQDEKVKNSKYFALANLIKFHTAAATKSSKEILQVLEQGLTDPNPNVYTMCCNAITAACEEESFPVNTGTTISVLSTALLNKLPMVVRHQEVVCDCLGMIVSRASDSDYDQVVKKTWESLVKFIKSEQEKSPALLAKLHCFLDPVLIRKLQEKDVAASLPDVLPLIFKAMKSSDEKEALVQAQAPAVVPTTTTTTTCEEMDLLLVSIASLVETAPLEFEKQGALKQLIEKLVSMVTTGVGESKIEVTHVALGLFETLIQSYHSVGALDVMKPYLQQIMTIQLTTILESKQYKEEIDEEDIEDDEDDDMYDLKCKATALNVVNACLIAFKEDCKPFAKQIISEIPKVMKTEDFRGIHDEEEYLEAHTAICTCISFLVAQFDSDADASTIITNEIIGNELKLAVHEEIATREEEQLERYYTEICCMVQAVIEKFGKASLKQLTPAIQKFVKCASKLKSAELNKFLAKLK